MQGPNSPFCLQQNSRCLITSVQICLKGPRPSCPAPAVLHASACSTWHTNSEDTVISRLERLGCESYWPKFSCSIIDRRSHRKRRVIKPLYPCYLFVRSRLFYFLFDVEGITGVVMQGESPAGSDRLDAEIGKLRSSESDGLVPAPIVEIAPRLSVGRKVVILSGILKGHLGTCEEFRSHQKSRYRFLAALHQSLQRCYPAVTDHPFTTSNNARRRIDQLQMAS